MNAEISITLDVSEKYTEEQFREWLEWELKLRSDLSIKNPLSKYDLSILCDDGNEDEEIKNYCNIDIR